MTDTDPMARRLMADMEVAWRSVTIAEQSGHIAEAERAYDRYLVAIDAYIAYVTRTQVVLATRPRDDPP